MKKTELKRKASLAADPAKVRSWKDRAARKAAENAATKPRKPLALSQLARVVPPAQTKRATTPAPKRPRRVVFKAKSPAREQWCFSCDRTVGAPRRRASSHHHWLPQRVIREYVMTLRLPEHEERPLLRRLLADERNLSPTCEHCHGQHELHAEAFSRHDVPISAFGFADELGPEWGERLRRMYPADDGDSDQGPRPRGRQRHSERGGLDA